MTAQRFAIALVVVAATAGYAQDSVVAPGAKVTKLAGDFLGRKPRSLLVDQVGERDFGDLGASQRVEHVDHPLLQRLALGVNLHQRL